MSAVTAEPRVKENGSGAPEGIMESAEVIETEKETKDQTMEVSAIEEDDEETKMRKAARQVEFYFADSNLPFDKFMWTLHTSNPDHWVPLSTVASFKRMRGYNALGLEWVAKALGNSEELELDETKTKVRRRTEVQEPKDQFQRSIYAKGFGKEEPDMQAKLEEFFERYGSVSAVRMRRMDETKEFKSSVFVEFSHIRSVEAFLNADPKPTWNGTPLVTMTKEAYCDMKIKEKGLTGKAAATRRDMLTSRKGFNAFREMAKQKGGSSNGKEKQKPEIWLEFMGSKIRVYEEDGGTIKEEDVPYTKGATLKFVGSGENVKFTELKDALRSKFIRVPFVKHTRGEDHGFVGFDRAIEEEEVNFVKETLKTLDSKEVEWSFPTEEEEKLFQIERAKTAASSTLAHRQNGGKDNSRGGKRGGRGGGRGGRGGRGGGRGGRGGRDRNAADKPSSSGAGAGPEDSGAGEKRKRAIEPDGGPDVGVRGKDAPPMIQSAKKTKVAEDAS